MDDAEKTRLVVPASVLAAVRAHAAREAPLEACGYLAGRGRRVHEAHPMRNVDASPEHFSFDPREQFTVLRTVREKGLELIAVYHSHPSSPARMSEEDRRLAFDPDIVYVIYSLCRDEIRGFTRRDPDGPEMEEVIVEIAQ